MTGSRVLRRGQQDDGSFDRDLFSALSAAGGEFLLVGGHAEGVEFEAAWRRCSSTTYGGVTIHVLSIEDLLTNKRAVGRPQDLLDVENLERRRRE